MEYSISNIEIKRSEIKPNELLKNYTRLIDQEAAQYFPAGRRKASSCPGCGSATKEADAEKLGFAFSRCTSCYTLYVSSRPEQKDLDQFYRNSQARKFWLEEIWGHTEKVRHEKIISPLMTWIDDFLAAELPKNSGSIADLYSIHPGIYRAWKEHPTKTPVYLVEPSFVVNGTEDRDCLPLSTDKQFDAVLLIDAVNRLEDPAQVLIWAQKHLRDGGLCFLTTYLSTGLDLLTLGAASDGVIPPDHLNLFSYEGLKLLAQKAGFEILELSTPGVLDLQNVENALTDPALARAVPAFFRYVFEKRKSPEFALQFQKLLQEFQLSSRGRVVLKKGNRK